MNWWRRKATLELVQTRFDDSAKVVSSRQGWKNEKDTVSSTWGGNDDDCLFNCLAMDVSAFCLIFGAL